MLLRNIVLYLVFQNYLCNSISNSSWTVYIDESLRASIQQSSSHMIKHLRALHSKVLLLETWCNLPSTSDINVNNTLLWAPCGAVQYVNMQMEIQVYWDIKVNSNFYIEIIFLLFDVDTPDVFCSNSMLIIKERLDRKFCGKRQPWSQVVPLDVALLILRQIDVFTEIELSFTYCIFDLLEVREKILTSRISIVPLPEKRTHRLSNIELNSQQFAVIWYLQAPIGKVLTITLSSLHTFDQMSIYKGFGRCHPAREIEVQSRRLQIIRYYAASIYLQRNITTLEKMYTLYFIQTNMTATTLSASRTRVHNYDEILYYKLFSIQSKHHSHETYLNVSFHVRDFQGWHNGDCTYGGFLFRHKYKQLKHHTLGPYCKDNDPNHPLIGIPYGKVTCFPHVNPVCFTWEHMYFTLKHIFSTFFLKMS